MTDEQIPQDLENQLAGPGGQFPGTAETLATPVGSDQPVRVKIGQQANKHLRLSREAYRARSAEQQVLDAQADASTNPTQEPQVSAADLPTPPPAPHSHRRRSTQRKPKPAVPKDQPIGQPSPAPLTTAAPTPPIPIPTDTVLEQRMSRLERGVDLIVQHIAERDDRREQVCIPDEPVDYSDVAHLAETTDERTQDAAAALAELDEELQDDLDELDAEPGPGESCDEPPPHVTTQVEDEPELDAGLQELQQMILKRNPQKVFRQYWCQLSRAAQYNEWPPKRREAFNEVFNSMVAHPKFVHQMSKFLRGSRSGNCIGNEQIARVCGMVAGFLTVYQLAAAGR